MQSPAAICYVWGRYTLSSYDDIIEKIEQEGKMEVESIQKIMITEDELKVVATYYYVRGAIDNQR